VESYGVVMDQVDEGPRTAERLMRAQLGTNEILDEIDYEVCVSEMIEIV